MLKLNSVLLFSDNPSKLVSYYKKVFKTDPSWSGGDFVAFGDKYGSLIIGPHDKVHGKNNNPERMMINFETKDVEKEFERIKKIEGTQVISKPYSPKEDASMQLATLSDPDNNYFQLNTPMG